MALLIRNAYVFAPQEIGPADVLMTDEKITAVEKNLSVSLPNLSIIDASVSFWLPASLISMFICWAEAA